MVFGGEFNPIVGMGTLLQRGDGGDPLELFQSVAHVISIGGIDLQLDVIEASTIQSAQNHEEFIPGIVKPGSVSFSVHLIPKEETHVGLINDLQNKALRNFRLILPDGDQSVDQDDNLNTFWEFAGYVTKFGINSSIDDSTKASIEVKISGVPTLTA